MLAKIPQVIAEEPGNSSHHAQKSAAQVLIVDDESLVRWSVSEALRSRGFDVREAGDAASALRMIDGNCDLVLLDLHLPDTQDLRVLSSIRAKAPSLPVIIMTAFATREIVEDAAAMHVPIISKPFDLDDLASAVERAAAGRIY